MVVENDVRAAAWGEFVARGRQGSLVAVFVGTGVGFPGPVLDGRLWRGSGNAAGVVGHTQVGPRWSAMPLRASGLSRDLSGVIGAAALATLS